ncbi:MAG: dihydrodipicolinate synthase family protein [Herminiimonas sp.]|nr:dihydrodipicolinate synthase family protein [Herminiimonas sp.]
MKDAHLKGVYAPVLTPFRKDLSPDVEQFVSHCAWLVERKAGLAIFGTNSEAASLSVTERLDLTDAVLQAGIPATSLMPGTGACSLTDAVILTTHAVKNGAPGVLVLPPFFYKNVSDDGLFAYYSELVERVGDAHTRIYLYHIPQISHAPISLSLIERLLKRYPQVIAGLKDSSGNWENSRLLIDTFAADGFGVFPASEALLSEALRLGGAGCISATVNINPAGIASLYSNWDKEDGPSLQREAGRVRALVQQTPMIPAMKYLIAASSGLPQWSTVRPPLVTLPEEQGRQLINELEKIDFRLDPHND